MENLLFDFVDLEQREMAVVVVQRAKVYLSDLLSICFRSSLAPFFDLLSPAKQGTADGS